MVTIGAPRVVTPQGLLHGGVVEVADGRIARVHPRSAANPDVVLESGVLVPGLIDLQVNGCFGTDFVDATSRQWHELTTALLRTGVTAFLPTFITAPVPHLAAALTRTAALLPELPECARARVLGVHLEGPFLAPSRRGAHNAAHLCDPTPAAVEALLEAGGGLLTLVTLAPEREGGLEAVRRLTSAGVVVSVGHTDATAEQVATAADAGARMVTHLFNAQRPLHHREPGVVGQALVDGRLALGLIADLHHVAAAACRIAFASAPGRVVLVTDAAAAAGMPPGRYDLGGEPVILADGNPPLREDGTIAGSALRLDEAVANTVGIGIDLVTAVDAATRAPADLIGRRDLGRIAPGAIADLVWMDDRYRTRATWIGGELAFAEQPVTS